MLVRVKRSSQLNEYHLHLAYETLVAIESFIVSWIKETYSMKEDCYDQLTQDPVNTDCQWLDSQQSAPRAVSSASINLEIRHSQYTS